MGEIILLTVLYCEIHLKHNLKIVLAALLSTGLNYAPCLQILLPQTNEYFSQTVLS